MSFHVLIQKKIWAIYYKSLTLSKVILCRIPLLKGDLGGLVAINSLEKSHPRCVSTLPLKNLLLRPPPWQLQPLSPHLEEKGNLETIRNLSKSFPCWKFGKKQAFFAVETWNPRRVFFSTFLMVYIPPFFSPSTHKKKDSGNSMDSTSEGMEKAFEKHGARGPYSHHHEKVRKKFKIWEWFSIIVMGSYRDHL